MNPPPAGMEIQMATTIVTPKRTKELLSVQQVAHLLKVDDTTIRRWITKGIFPAIRLPHKGRRVPYRIKVEDVEKLLNEPVEVIRTAKYKY